MNNFKISIPNPCNESWDNMTPTGNGRHCETCNKTVVDFTKKSAQEISTYLNNAEAKICGRFKAAHVYQPTVIDASQNYIKPSWFRSRWMAMFTLVSFVSFGKKSHAQLVGQAMVNKTTPVEEEKSNVKQTSTVIHGWIKNSATKKGVSEVEIRIYSGGKEIAYSTSFTNGSYFITVPPQHIYDFKIDLEYNSATYKAQVLKDLPVNKDRIKCDVNLVSFTAPAGLSCELRESIGEVVEPEYYPVREIATMGEPVRDKTTEISKKMTTTTQVAPLLHNDSLMNITTTYNVEKIDTNTIPLTITTSSADFKVTAYPNPGPGLFNFKIDNSEKNEIFIFNLEGKLVASKKTNASLETIDITNQPNGTYVVRVVSMTQNKVKQIKVVKAN